MWNEPVIKLVRQLNQKHILHDTRESAAEIDDEE